MSTMPTSVPPFRIACGGWFCFFFVLTLFGVFKFDIWKVLTSSGEVVYFCVELKFAGSESSR